MNWNDLVLISQSSLVVKFNVNCSLYQDKDYCVKINSCPVIIFLPWQENRVWYFNKVTFNNRKSIINVLWKQSCGNIYGNGDLDPW